MQRPEIKDVVMWIWFANETDWLGSKTAILTFRLRDSICAVAKFCIPFFAINV